MKKSSAIALISIFCLYLPKYSIGADFHVSTNGANSPSCGAINSPCATTSYTIGNRIDSGTNVIKVAAGNYSGSVHITTPMSSLTLQGGWNEAFTNHLCSPTNTVYTAPSGFSPLFVSPIGGGSINVAIQCMQISSQANNNSYGINASAVGTGANLIFSMKNCIVDSFDDSGIRVISEDFATVQATLTDNLIYGNQQPLYQGAGGAGVRIKSSDNASTTLKMHRNRIIDNLTLASGGGLHFEAHSNGSIDAELENNIIAENWGSLGGAGISVIGFNGSIDLTLTNNTITNNVTDDGIGGGLWIRSDTNKFSSKLRNNIIWGNFDAFGTHGDDITMAMSFVIPDDGSGINVDYSIVGKVYVAPGEGHYIEGVHNLNTDPDLTSEYLLAGNSPAINTGQCGFSFITYKRVAPYDDIEGDSRPGFGQIAGCDIGADELVLPFSWSMFLPAIIKR